MSTITKLDPRVRRSRADRRDTVRSLGRVVSQLSGFKQFAAGAIHSLLIDVQRNPTLTGTQKNGLFSGLIARLQEQSSPQQGVT